MRGGVHMQDTRSVVISMANLPDTLWAGFRNDGCRRGRSRVKYLVLCADSIMDSHLPILVSSFFSLCPPAVMDPPEERRKRLDWLNSRWA